MDKLISVAVVSLLCWVASSTGSTQAQAQPQMFYLPLSPQAQAELLVQNVALRTENMALRERNRALDGQLAELIATHTQLLKQSKEEREHFADYGNQIAALNKEVETMRQMLWALPNTLNTAPVAGALPVAVVPKIEVATPLGSPVVAPKIDVGSLVVAAAGTPPMPAHGARLMNEPRPGRTGNPIISHLRKTRLCKYFKVGKCHRDSEECAFAHGEGELRTI
eukprot:123615_1